MIPWLALGAFVLVYPLLLVALVVGTDERDVMREVEGRNPRPFWGFLRR